MAFLRPASIFDTFSLNGIGWFITNPYLTWKFSDFFFPTQNRRQTQTKCISLLLRARIFCRFSKPFCITCVQKKILLFIRCIVGRYTTGAQLVLALYFDCFVSAFSSAASATRAHLLALWPFAFSVELAFNLDWLVRARATWAKTEIFVSSLNFKRV